jgi:hypothetical protein
MVPAPVTKAVPTFVESRVYAAMCYSFFFCVSAGAVNVKSTASVEKSPIRIVTGITAGENKDGLTPVVTSVSETNVVGSSSRPK